MNFEGALNKTYAGWKIIDRPGYFGRRRDAIIKGFNEDFGPNQWKLAWYWAGPAWNLSLDPSLYYDATVKDPASYIGPAEGLYEFADACRLFYEESYIHHFTREHVDIDFACTYGECIDNAETNVKSGLDYTIQEAFSTHIQDIAMRNTLKRLGRKFEGPEDKILVIRSKDSEGYRFGPGNVPFFGKTNILQPSLCPGWGKRGTVEDFWQSNKVLAIRNKFEGEF